MIQEVLSRGHFLAARHGLGLGVGPTLQTACAASWSMPLI